MYDCMLHIYYYLTYLCICPHMMKNFPRTYFTAIPAGERRTALNAAPSGPF